ncbi:hypothetical protein FCL54_14605 [Pseudalkalibacillus caeni]|uniref:DNA/RNA non-specific endonuclease/pyrophosphatase/phosphodiesterase domain-containing protein n=1 Tax=Exobacillus caeni TaxID=2574798 RepID=A0A5R9EYS9_9BACL|nr:hypothetical protein FCL54_14605 [Pseudalkalibacillus caeni]
MEQEQYVYKNREDKMTKNRGFDPSFLENDYSIPFPVLNDRTGETALNGGEIFPYTHFSIVMNEQRKLALYCAHNIDLNNHNNVKRCKDCWHFDQRIGVSNQVGNDLYRGEHDL